MRIYQEKLPHGLDVVIAPMHDTQTVTILILVAAGTAYETKHINGISHFLEHLCFKGTKERPTPSLVSHAFDDLGAENNAFTAEEYTGYYVKVHARQLDAALDLVTDIYLNPTFPSEEIEREKGVVLEEINLYNDQPTWHVQDLITDVLYGDQPAGWEILGTKKNLTSFTRDQIVSYRKKHYVAAGTTVVVAGDVRAGTMKKKIVRAFADVAHTKKGTKRRVKENQTTPAVGVRYRKTDQAHLALAFRTVSFRHKDTWALQLLATLLGSGMSSRLFRRMRDELGMCYYINARNRFFTDHGYFAVHAGVTKGRVYEAIEEIISACKKIKDEPVASAELRKVKNYHIGMLHLGLETTESHAWLYGIPSVLGREALSAKEHTKRLCHVTSADIQRVAKRTFQDARCNLAVVGPYKNTKRFTEILHI